MGVENTELNNLLKNELGDNYLISDLAEITMLKIDFLFDYKELLKLSNLEELKFNSIEIEEELLIVLNDLPNLKKLYFVNCDIENLGALDNRLDELYMERTILKDISVLNKFTKLKSLSFVGMGEVDLKNISVIKNIESINLMNSKIINEDCFIYLNKVVNLCISNTRVLNIDTLIGIESLKKLVIDEEIYISNIKVVNYLMDRSVEVTNIYGESFGDVSD